MAEPTGWSVKILPSGKCCCLNERIFPVEGNWRIEFRMELFLEIAELKLFTWHQYQQSYEWLGHFGGKRQHNKSFFFSTGRKFRIVFITNLGLKKIWIIFFRFPINSTFQLSAKRSYCLSHRSTNQIYRSNSIIITRALWILDPFFFSKAWQRHWIRGLWIQIRPFFGQRSFSHSYPSQVPTWSPIN